MGVVSGGGAGAAPVVREGTLRKKELVERVAEVSGAKKKVVKGIVEATLKVLGDALSRDEVLALPPFGKAKVNRQKDTGGGEMLIVKIRRAAPGPKGADPLASGGE
jgi:DNA-binding protein HU-alpha